MKGKDDVILNWEMMMIEQEPPTLTLILRWFILFPELEYLITLRVDITFFHSPDLQIYRK